MVYVFLADGFEELEAIAPIDVLRRAGAELVTVGVGSRQITSAHNIGFTADITAEEIRLDPKLEMIVLPGGMPGADNLENSPEVQAAIDYCAENDKWIAAICAAPKILGHKGLLAGVRCTCFPGYEKALKNAILCPDAVVRDGKFVTAKGAGAALKFALKLVEVLYGKERSSALASSMQFK